ncbi:tyrosine protein kinase [Lactococcus hodotermopsidis]|uniref:Capsular polysaccharide biosynthesis protein CpsC n=1 Tax=Pseudolactococcus hodotermopsidis TaxID=2709157 RepID=A0A6A0BBW2_9LACT|nr:Wzz/FepE/Etk N-terminal domain-containing protein [Lactococcus hodotermopsidis]GFH41874.1 tyrosine protein kinase [Lactococcus hodotermopsidis]
MEETISLENIFNIIKKRVLLLISCLIIGLSIAAALTFLVITPKYSSQAQIIVQSKDTTNSNLQSDISGNVLLINTYKDMIKGNFVMESVQKQLVDNTPYRLSVSELKSSISIAQAQNSQMFQIAVLSKDPKEAEVIVNTVAEVFKTRAGEVLDVTKVTIISKGHVPTTPVSPNNKLNLMIGAVLGLLIGTLLVFLVEFLDKTVKDDKFVTEQLELPILGAIGQFDIKNIHHEPVKVIEEVKVSKMEEVVEDVELVKVEEIQMLPEVTVISDSEEEFEFVRSKRRRQRTREKI